MFNYIKNIISRNKTWTCQDGKKIRIKHMDNNHLINAINMIRKNTRNNLELIAGTSALPAVNDVWDLHARTSLSVRNWVDEKMKRVDKIIPIYKDLTQEADRRNITYERR